MNGFVFCPDSVFAAVEDGTAFCNRGFADGETIDQKFVVADHFHFPLGVSVSLLGAGPDKSDKITFNPIISFSLFSNFLELVLMFHQFNLATRGNENIK